MHVKHGERGQTIAESAIFLPIVLLVLFGIMYVSQYGVASERAQLAVRYGGLVMQRAANVYSASEIYDFLSNPKGPAPCVSPPPGFLTDEAPLPGPASVPYWQPLSVVPSCTALARQPQGGGGQFVASHFFSTALESVTAQVAVPPFLGNAIGMNASASEAFVQSADPSAILYCSSDVRTLLNNVLNIAPSPGSTPYPSASPPPLTYNC
jgi:hypothetical protein